MLARHHTWVNFVRPLFLRLQLRQAPQFVLRGVEAGSRRVEPSVGVDTSPLVPWHVSSLSRDWAERKRTHRRPSVEDDAISPCAVSVWTRGAACGGGDVHLPIWKLVRCAANTTAAMQVRVEESEWTWHQAQDKKVSGRGASDRRN